MLLLTGAFLLTGLLVIVRIVRECGKERFCARLSTMLSRRLGAEVVIWPMQSHSLLFLDCPLIQVRDPAGRWAFRAQDARLELLPSRILAGGLGFHSVKVRDAELWMGGNLDSQGMIEPEELEKEAAKQSNGLPWWLDGRLRDLSGIPLETIEISSLKIRGHDPEPEDSPLEIETAATGSLRDGRLDWSLQKGRFEVPGQGNWTVDEFSGTWGKNAFRVHKGQLTCSNGAVVSCQSEASQAPGQLAIRVEASQLTFHPSGMELEEAVGPVSKASAAVKGVLGLHFPEVQRYHFSGDVELDGLRVGQSKIFQLLAGQTGEEKLKHPEARKLTGHVECNPGVVQLSRLSLRESELFRLEGRLSVVDQNILGAFDLALPVALVGRMPGGKPQGFSYPASGWSWAKLRLEGKSDQWQEVDLSRRLMAQISPDIPVAPRKLAMSNPKDEAKQREALAAATQRKKEAMEQLFYSLIGD